MPPLVGSANGGWPSRCLPTGGCAESVFRTHPEHHAKPVQVPPQMSVAQSRRIIARETGFAALRTLRALSVHQHYAICQAKVPAPLLQPLPHSLQRCQPALLGDARSAEQRID